MLTRWQRIIREHFAFILLLTASAVTYIAVASVQWYNMDEGAYLNAAATVAHGGLPFLNFAAREPAILYYLAIGVSLFGPHLLIARLQMVAVDLLTGVAVYLLARDIGGKTAGLAAAGLFFFNPFDVYAFTTVLLEPLAALPLAWIAYLLLRKAKPDIFWVPLIVGLLMGFAELARRDAILLAPLVLGAMVLRLSPGLKPLPLKGVIWLILGFAIPVGLVLGYFTSQTSLPWMWDEYGLGAAYVDHAVPLNFHAGVLYYLWVYEPLLVIPAVAVPAGNFAARGNRDLAFLSLMLSAALLGSVLYLGPRNFDWGQGEYVLVATGGLLAVQLLLWGLTAFDLEFSSRPGPWISWIILVFLDGWVVFFLGFYTLVYPEFFTNYFTDVSVPLSILAGVWWADRVGDRLGLGLDRSGPAASAPTTKGPRGSWVSPLFALVLTTALVGTGLFSAVEVLGPSNPYNQPTAYDLPQYNVIQRTYSPQTVTEVANYLDARTPANATLFSADDIFLAEADRSNLMNLSIALDHMAYNPYPNDQTAYPYDPYHLLPSIDELLATWNDTWVPYVIVGSRQSIMDEMHPAVGEYIQDHYHVSATFGNSLSWNYVAVWERGPAPAAPATLVREYPAGVTPASLTVDPTNDTIFSGSLDSPVIHAISASGTEWNFTLPRPFEGVRDLAYDNGTGILWVAIGLGSSSAISQVVGYALVPGSAPLFLGASSVGYAPVSIAFDDVRHLMFVASLGFSNVTVLNSTTGKFVTSYMVGSGPLAVAVDPRTATLYEAASGEDHIELYNETTGTLIASIFVGAPPTNLLLTPRYYLVTSWAPGEVYWVNRSTGSVDYNASVGDGAQGLSLSGDTVAVASQETGTVSFFNATSALPQGTLSTGGCPNAIGYSSDGRDLYEVGPCPSPLTTWKMGTLLNWTIDIPYGGAVFLDGSYIPTGVPIPVYPGLFSLLTVVDGRVDWGSQTYVRGSGSWTPPMGPTLSEVMAVQNSFTDYVTIASVVVILLVAGAAAISTPPSRKMEHGRPPPGGKPPPSPPKTEAKGRQDPAAERKRQETPASW